MGKAKIRCGMCGGSGVIDIRQPDGSWKTVTCGECSRNPN